MKFVERILMAVVGFILALLLVFAMDVSDTLRNSFFNKKKTRIKLEIKNCHDGHCGLQI